MAAALPYQEPGIVTILILSSFLLLLNILNYVLDYLICCGLLGQIFVGVVWTQANFLGETSESLIVQLGYLGLILLVYEGGLSTSFSSVKANLAISIAVAITGIGLPIVLSYILQKLAGASPLLAFTAGAALSSTSLGTTFTILGTCGLTTTQLGTVLTTAAMLDDVVGLIMVQVISNLGTSARSLNSITVVRPIVVSIGLVIVLLLACRFLLVRMTVWLNSRRERAPTGILQRLFTRSEMAILIHTVILLGFVTGATYAGTSNLFAAYLAGASISWWDSGVPHSSLQESGSMVTPTPEKAPSDSSTQQTPLVRGSNEVNTNSIQPPPNDLVNKQSTGTSKKGNELQANLEPPSDVVPLTGRNIYRKYYGAVAETILKPLFFASIGFSIPITQMFKGPIVWRGIVYTVLMALGKIFTGVWLVRSALPWLRPPRRFKLPSLPGCCCWETSLCMKVATTDRGDNQQQAGRPRFPVDQSQEVSRNVHQRRTTIPKPRSLYPASIIGAAMISRGEIGFLIASIAESKGIFANTSSSRNTAQGDRSEIYLIVIWAVVLCTFIGPISVGTLARRLKKLQTEGHARPATIDPLGIWGVI